MTEVSFQPMTVEGAERLGVELAAIDPWAHYGYAPEALSSYFKAKEDDAPRFEIIADGTLSGAICVRKNWLRGPYLQLLAVLPSFQGRGVGGVAISWFEAQAQAAQSQNIWVVASAFNTGALALYERHGFVPAATLEGLVADGTDEILLRKRLKVA
jgi:ribosomal protein S18 acetylase RimI-like enzyme